MKITVWKSTSIAFEAVIGCSSSSPADNLFRFFMLLGSTHLTDVRQPETVTWSHRASRVWVDQSYRGGSGVIKLGSNVYVYFFLYNVIPNKTNIQSQALNLRLLTSFWQNIVGSALCLYDRVRPKTATIISSIVLRANILHSFYLCFKVFYNIHSNIAFYCPSVPSIPIHKTNEKKTKTAMRFYFIFEFAHRYRDHLITLINSPTHEYIIMHCTKHQRSKGSIRCKFHPGLFLLLFVCMIFCDNK